MSRRAKRSAPAQLQPQACPVLEAARGQSQENAARSVSQDPRRPPGARARGSSLRAVRQPGGQSHHEKTEFAVIGRFCLTLSYIS